VTGVARAKAAAKTASVKMRHAFLNFMEVCGKSRASSVYATRGLKISIYLDASMSDKI
jgi:hypothetical protein